MNIMNEYEYFQCFTFFTANEIDYALKIDIPLNCLIAQTNKNYLFTAVECCSIRSS